MGRYRKKPIEVDAVEVTEAFLSSKHQHESFQTDDGIDYLITYTKKGVLIETLEGTMAAEIGDWIITGVKHEMYPCKPDVFESTYEKVEE